MAKSKTLDQVEAMRQKAVRFLENVVGDSDRAAEVDNMSPQEYAEQKKIKIVNPRRWPSTIPKGNNATMPKPTYTDLLDRVAELETENEELTDKLDSILEIAGAEDSDDSDSDDDLD